MTQSGSTKVMGGKLLIIFSRHSVAGISYSSFSDSLATNQIRQATKVEKLPVTTNGAVKF